MRRYLPEDILFRRKMGFVTPISTWFRGALASEATGLISSTALAETEWFNRPAIKQIVEEHQSGRKEHGRLIWQLLMLDRSLRRVFGLGQASG